MGGKGTQFSFSICWTVYLLLLLYIYFFLSLSLSIRPTMSIKEILALLSVGKDRGDAVLAWAPVIVLLQRARDLWVCIMGERG